jgi:hypothetical protein
VPSTKNAKLVTLRVGQHDPGLLTLADIDTLCTMGHWTSDLGVLIIRPEVEMQPALAHLGHIDPAKSTAGRRRLDEIQARPRCRNRHCASEHGSELFIEQSADTQFLRIFLGLLRA